MQTWVFQIALFKGFPNIPHIPYLWDTQWTQMRQQWIQALKTLRVGMIGTVPERYASRVVGGLQGGQLNPTYYWALCRSAPFVPLGSVVL